MRYVKAFLLGVLAFGILAYALAAVAAMTAQADGRSLDLALGPLSLVSVAGEGSAIVTSFGPGIPALALAGGLLNLAAAVLSNRRAGGRTDHVD